MWLKNRQITGETSDFLSEIDIFGSIAAKPYTTL